MSWSGSGKPDPVLEGVELLFYQKGGSASFCTKMALYLNGVDPGCTNSINGSTCRAKCSNILHDTSYLHFSYDEIKMCILRVVEIYFTVLGKMWQCTWRGS